MIEYFIKFGNCLVNWVVFEVYFHFAIYHDDYKFFTNIVFDHLISISKWDILLQFYSLDIELPYSRYHLQKTLLILAW